MSLVKNTLWNQRFSPNCSFEFGLTWLLSYRGIPLPTRLAVSHRVSRPRWARGRKRLLVGHWLYVVLRTRGRCTLDRKDGRQIVRRLSGGNLRHYCIQEPALCDGGSMVVWVGIHKGGKTSLVAPDGNVNAFM